MLMSIKVIANAKKNLIKKEEASWKVYLCAPAAEGKANKALIELLSREFKVSKSAISIIKGLKSRQKIVNISNH